MTFSDADMAGFAGADITIRGLGRAEFRVPLTQGTEDCTIPN